MKNLVEYLTEAQLDKDGILFKLTRDNAQSAILLSDRIRDFIKHSKTRYSFNNQDDLKKFFKAFCDSNGKNTGMLRAMKVTDGKQIAELIITNKERLEKHGWDFTAIKSFDETAMEKEFKKWKESDDFKEGRPVDKKDYKDANDEVLKRTLVIYDVNWPGNPDTTRQYDFEGKRSADNMHQIHMLRMEWRHETGGKYYDAREILLSNYLKKSDDELKERSFFDDDVNAIDNDIK